MIHATRGNREPDVRDHARTGCFENFALGPGRTRPGMAISASHVETGLLERLVILRPSVFRKETIVAVAAALCLNLRRPRCRQARCRHQPAKKTAPVVGLIRHVVQPTTLAPRTMLFNRSTGLSFVGQDGILRPIGNRPSTG